MSSNRSKFPLCSFKPADLVEIFYKRDIFKPGQDVTSSAQGHMTSTKKSLGLPMARQKDCRARDGDGAAGMSCESLLPWRPEKEVGGRRVLPSPGDSASSCLSGEALASCLVDSDSLSPLPPTFL